VNVRWNGELAGCGLSWPWDLRLIGTASSGGADGSLTQVVTAQVVAGSGGLGAS
jgi:hypothetical protein